MVNTFLPLVAWTNGCLDVEKTIRESLKVLDPRRLQKQRVEAMQIFNGLTGGKGWSNHPATKMWAGCLELLAYYHDICLEIVLANGVATIASPLLYQLGAIGQYQGNLPWWFGWLPLADSHKASLLRKHPIYYQTKFKCPGYALERGYIWPTHLTLSQELFTEHPVDHPEWYAAINWDTAKNSFKSKENCLTVVQAKDLLRQLNIPFNSKMKKGELMDLLSISQIQQYLTIC